MGLAKVSCALPGFQLAEELFQRCPAGLGFEVFGLCWFGVFRLRVFRGALSALGH